MLTGMVRHFENAVMWTVRIFHFRALVGEVRAVLITVNLLHSWSYPGKFVQMTETFGQS